MTTTQQAILAAATKLFKQDGFAGVSLRQIAKEAVVEPSIIIRHFGSKEELFLRAIDIDSQNEIAAIPVGELGEILIQGIFDDGEKADSVMHSLGVLLQASESERVQAEFQRTTEELLVKPIACKLNGDNVELRARLIAAQIIGLLVQLFVIHDRNLLAAPREDIVRHYGAAIQRLADD